jgi:hypothetical protein
LTYRLPMTFRWFHSILAAALLGASASAGGEKDRLAEFEARLFEADPVKQSEFFYDTINGEYHDLSPETLLPLVLRYAKTMQSRPEPKERAGRDLAVGEHLFLKRFAEKIGEPLAPELLRLAREPDNWWYCRMKEIEMLGRLIPEDAEFHAQLIEFVGDPKKDVALVSARLLSELEKPTAEMLAAIEARIALGDIQSQSQLLTFGAAIERKLHPLDPDDAREIVSRPEGRRLVEVAAAMQTARELDGSEEISRRQIDDLYHAYLDAIERQPDQRLGNLARNHLKALPPTDADAVATRLLEFLPERHPRIALAVVLDNIRPFPPRHSARLIEMVGSEEMAWNPDNDRMLLTILAEQGPRSAAVLPKILAKFEAIVAVIVRQIEEAESDDWLSRTQFGSHDHLRNLLGYMIAIGPGDKAVHQVLLERFAPDSPLGKALARYDRAANRRMMSQQLLMAAELSWPDLESRNRDLFALALDLLAEPEAALNEPGCDLLVHLAPGLTDEQVSQALPFLIEGLNAVPDETNQSDWHIMVRPHPTLSALNALGPRAKPALEAVERFSSREIPEWHHLGNHGLVSFLQLAKVTEQAIRGEAEQGEND